MATARETRTSQSEIASGIATLDAPTMTAVVEAQAVGHRRRFSPSSMRTFDALNDRSFRWFFASMLAQFSSMHMQMVVNPWLVYQLTGSYAALGAIALVSSIPGLVLGFAGGVVADRAPKKIVVQIGQAISATATLGVALLIAFDMIMYEHLLALAAIQGAVFAIVGPARQAFIPEIVGPARLTNAVALNMAAMNVTRMGVPALGGLLVAFIGAEGVFFVMAALIFVAMFTLTPVKKHAMSDADKEVLRQQEQAGFGGIARTQQGNARSIGGGFRDVADGIRYISQDRVVLVLLAMNFFIVLMSMPYMQMMAGFVEQVLGEGPQGLGILWSMTGVGSLIGSLAIASMPNRGRGKIFLYSALLLGVALVGFAASTWFWVTAAVMVVVGVGSAGRMSLGNILIMSYTHPAYQGRVMSVFMMEFSLVSFGTFLVGIMAEVWGVQWAIGATAFSLVIVAVAGLLFVPRVRDLP
jgi:MFS family permease